MATEDIKKVGELIKDIRFAMMTTVSETGHLHSRPMAVQEMEFDGDFWFFTSNNSGKIESIEQDQHVNLAFTKEDDNRWISIAGRAQVVTDRQKMKELWNPLMKTWFPKGVDDPELCLIRVTAESAEYWDAPSSKIVHLYGLAKAIVTGERPNPGGHDRVDLQH